MGKRPYCPAARWKHGLPVTATLRSTGSLREALDVQAKEDQTEARVITALKRVGLSFLLQSLDRVERWEEELSVVEQHRLALARVLLNKPEWVISDEALDILGDDASDGILSIFQKELAGTAVVSFARRPQANDFYSRVLHVVGPPGHKESTVNNF